MTDIVIFAIFIIYSVTFSECNVPPPIDFSLANAKKSDIKFELYKNPVGENKIVISDNNVESQIEQKLPTKVFIHGYTQDPSTSPWYEILKSKYFNRQLHNIIYVDWSKAGNFTIEKAAANIKNLGEFIGDLLIASKIRPENIHLIGFSLAGHMPGFAGKHYFKKTGTKLGRITSLDPAGYSFEIAGPEGRLSDQDAKFVDVIHTDINNFGLVKPVGHVDFYPNGGKNQPGCPPHDVNGYCNHGRSIDYFIESIDTRNATGKKIKFDTNNQTFTLQGGEDVVFGDAAAETARGVYFLETNADIPFLKTFSF